MSLAIRALASLSDHEVMAAVASNPIGIVDVLREGSDGNERGEGHRER